MALRSLFLLLRRGLLIIIVVSNLRGVNRVVLLNFILILVLVSVKLIRFFGLLIIDRIFALSGVIANVLIRGHRGKRTALGWFRSLNPIARFLRLIMLGYLILINLRVCRRFNASISDIGGL
jgi:hypothetical protein